MAIDTTAKRFSIINAAYPVITSPGLIPDGVISSGDRQTLLNAYNGVAFNTVNIPTLLFELQLGDTEIEITLQLGDTEVEYALQLGDTEIDLSLELADGNL